MKPVGLEGAYDTLLRGISGQRLMQKLRRDVWRPINDENEVEPKMVAIYIQQSISIFRMLLKTLLMNTD